MFKTILFFMLVLFFSACSVKDPVTWQSRIVKKQEFEYPSLVYSEYGKPGNKTLLFIHGFGESRKTWRFLVPRLSKQYHLVLVDLKGFGDSPKVDDDAYSVYDQARAVANFIEKKALKDITVVGRSFGGGVALVLALMQEDQLLKKRLERLILINSMAYKQYLPSMMKLLNEPIIGYLGIHLMPNNWMAQEAYEYAFYNDKLIPKESVEYSAHYLSMPLAKYVYLKTVEQIIPEDIKIIERRYGDIEIPILILWGKEDVSIRVKMAHRLHRDLKRSHLKILPNVGHMPNEEAPLQVIFEILKFMEESQ
jgi:pimeloyl-ACP methyl ester carboxylesterase